MRAASVEESALRSSDPADEVRAFYESHPYPAPLGNLDRHRELYRNPGSPAGAVTCSFGRRDDRRRIARF